MTKTLQEALSLLLIINSFCGSSVLEYPFGQPRLYLSYLYISMIWSIYTYLFYCVHISHITYTYMTVPNIIGLLASTLTIPISLFYFKELKTCLYEISVVDDTLQALGMLKEYQRLYNWTIRIIIGWIVIVCLTGTSDSLWLNYEYFSVTRIFIPFVLNYVEYINIFHSLMWGIMLGYMSSRFQKVNKHIYNLLDLNSERQNKLIQPRLKTKEYTFHIWIIMHIHQQLCVILRKLNKIFGIPMTLQMAASFTFFVDMTFVVYTAYINRNTATFTQILDSTFIFVWGLVYSTKLLMLNLVCQTIYDKTNNTIAVLYKLSNNNLDKDLQEQILQFILQIKQRNLRLSGMGLFYFGCDFIRQFYISVATIVVITLQMHITYKNIYIIPFNKTHISANA